MWEVGAGIGTGKACPATRAMHTGIGKDLGNVETYITSFGKGEPQGAELGEDVVLVHVVDLQEEQGEGEDATAEAHDAQVVVHNGVREVGMIVGMRIEE